MKDFLSFSLFRQYEIQHLNLMNKIFYYEGKQAVIDILNFKIDSAKSGLKTSINNRTGWNIAYELLEISMHGLEKRKQFNYSGESESQFLG